MKIAVVNETSAADKNKDIRAALDGRGHQIINAGMEERGAQPELQYIHTGLIGAILLNLGRVDFVVGGCGTGQGFLNSIMQYPGVVCGHITSVLDAWLFCRINGGNAVSLALNQGYGWAGDVNLRLVFDQLFSGAWATGYPPSRSQPQAASRATLAKVSGISHKGFVEIIETLPEDILRPILEYPGVWGLIDVNTIADARLKNAFLRHTCP
ncbi:MAG TPA: RpiB/LacA/LacB family sugar-phosphate isomerase [Spirochaetia bacterium]|nr:RpiB/LacA/LacB family sugar-phosphate isomerase [Spirochaetia bacterium]